MGRAEAVAIALWACPGHRRPWAGSSPQASAGWCRLWFEWFSTWSHGRAALSSGFLWRPGVSSQPYSAGCCGMKEGTASSFGGPRERERDPSQGGDTPPRSRDRACI